MAISCNPGTDSKGPTALLQKDTGRFHLSDNFSGCYELLLLSDSAYMNLEQSPTGYAGTLDYRPKELAKHNGFVVLQKDSTYLRGWYTSTNFEGKETHTEKIFKITTRGLTEGTGEMYERSDSALFKYPNNLAFEDNFPFLKKQCP